LYTATLPLRDEWRQRVAMEEIEQRLTSAGWNIDHSFSGYLVIGYSGYNLSILPYDRGVEENENDYLFEIVDHLSNITYWVREIPTPQQAAELLREHGKPREEWDKP
jgi:hypothetical protein